MDTHLATTQIRLQQWTRIIQDRINSGLKVDEYCEQHHKFRDNIPWTWIPGLFKTKRRQSLKQKAW